MNTTKAIRIHELGGPEVLRREEVALPSRGRAKCSSGTKPWG